MNNQFAHYSKTILKSMNTVEDITGKMFHELLPEFEAIFWIAYGAKHTKAMIELNELLNKIIDDLRAGNSFVLNRCKKL